MESDELQFVAGLGELQTEVCRTFVVNSLLKGKGERNLFAQFIFRLLGLVVDFELHQHQDRVFEHLFERL